MTQNAVTVSLNPFFRYATFLGLLVLLVLCVAWEWWIDPMVPGGSIFVLKALPLLFPLYGVYKGNLYTMQWTSLLILLYLLEGTVRGTSDISVTSRHLGLVETALSLWVFICAILYVRPAKKYARQRKKQGL